MLVAVLSLACAGTRHGSHLEQGVAHYDEGAYEDAARRFSLAWQEEADPDALFNLGLTQLKAMDMAAAAATYGEYVRLRPGDWQGHVNLAHALAGKGSSAEATTHFERAIDLHETWPEPYCAFAQHLLARGDARSVERAVALMDEALAIAPEHSTAWMLRGLANRARNDPNAARDDLAEAVRHDRDNARALLALADLELEAGERDTAIRRYLRLTVLTPHDSRAFLGAGICHRLRGEYRRALTHLWRARELADDEPRIEMEILRAEIGSLEAQLAGSGLDEAGQAELRDLLDELAAREN